MKKLLLFSIVLLASTLIGKAQINNFTFSGTDGNEHNLYEYLNDGNVVVMEFFFVNCGLCASFAPSFQQLYEENGSNQDGVIFLSLDVEESDSFESIENWDEDLGLTMPALYGVGIDIYWSTNVNPLTSSSGTPQLLVVKPGNNGAEDNEVTFAHGGFVTNSKVEELAMVIESSKTDTETDITEIESLSIQLFPNPVENILNIQLKTASQNLQIALFDLSGKLLLEEQVTSQLHKLDLTNWQNGTYLIQLSDGEQVLYKEAFQKK